MKNNNLNNESKKANAKTIALIIIVMLLVLAVGLLAGLFISGRGQTIINYVKESTEKLDDNSKNNGDSNTNASENDKEADENNISNANGFGGATSNNEQNNANSLFTKDDYVKTWETDPEDTEIQLYDNGVFVTDHYTKASEIKGSYSVDNNVIKLTTQDGKNWEGYLFIESGEVTLNINMDGKDYKFYDMKNHKATEKAEGVYTTTDLTVLGKYENKSEYDGHYHDAVINVTDQGESIIEFEISAVNGKDVDHVNIGQLKGKAVKVGVNKYVFEENVDGNNCKITFTFDAHRMFQWVDVEESFSAGRNPYAGNGVSFAGNYEFCF